MLSHLNMTYLSSGNIPSASANSMQVMKMSQTFSAQIAKFELVVEGDIWRNPFDLWGWYGISRPFKVVQLKTRWKRKLPLQRGYNSRRYLAAAALYVLWKRPSFVYTRHHKLAQFCWTIGVPTLLESHTKPYRIWKPKWNHYFKGLVTISDLLAKEYVKLGYPEDKIWVFADGVDLGQINSHSEPDYRCHSEAEGRRISQQQIRAVYTGHLYPNRGIDLISEAAAKIPNISFQLIGGWEEDIVRWRKIVRQKSLSNVEIVGFVPNVKLPSYLLSADILLMPYCSSLDTGPWMSPLKMFEYMAAGRCIIASDLPRVRNVLIDGETALFFEADNIDSFESALRRAAASAELRQKLGNSARKAVAPYDWNKRACEILKRVSGIST